MSKPQINNLLAAHIKARNELNQKQASAIQTMRQEHAASIRSLLNEQHRETTELIVSQTEARQTLVVRDTAKEYNLHFAVMIDQWKKERNNRELVPLPPQISTDDFKPSTRQKQQQFPLRQAPRQEATAAKQTELNRKSGELRNQDRMAMYKSRTWKKNAENRAPLNSLAKTKFARMRTTAKNVTPTTGGANKSRQQLELTANDNEEYVVDELLPKTPRYSPTKFD
jgi:hypothetical protein